MIVGSSDATVRAIDVRQPRLITISHGAPRVYITNLRLQGTVRIVDGHITITDCIIAAIPGEDMLVSERALSVLGGDVELRQSMLLGHSAGAIEAVAARLTIIESAVRSSRAHTGGALLVDGGAHVDILHSNFTDNSARVSGGAMQVMDPRTLKHISPSRSRCGIHHKASLSNS